MSRHQEYLVYTRRSTDDLINQKNSIEYQTKQCLAFAQTQGLVVAGLSLDGFCDQGVVQERHTAFKTASLDICKDGTVKYRIERPKFQRLVSLLAERKIKGVVCLCWDRLSRNPHDDAIIKDLMAKGTDMQFVEATYEDSSSGALHMDIDGMFSQHYSRVVSEKVRAANLKLRSEGKITNAAPIGYLNQGTGCKPLDPGRAPIIHRMFDLYASGEWSMSQLANWAGQQGLTTKPMRPRRTNEEILAGVDNNHEAKCHPVSPKTVENILHNPFYAGLIRYHGVEMPGVHEPLISQSLFERVQRVFQGRTFSVHCVDKPFFTYRGLVRCGCQRAYSPYPQKGHAYYYVHCGQGCINTKNNLSETVIDGLVEEVLGRVHLSKDEVSYLKRRAPKMFSRRGEEREARQEALAKQKIRVQRDLTYLEENKITLLREGAYTAAALAAATDKLEEELEQIRQKESQVETAEYDQMLDKVIEFSELVISAKESYKHFSEQRRRDVFTWGISELVVIGGKTAEVRAKDGFASLLKRPSFPSCGQDYVLSELESLYSDVIRTIGDLKFFLYPQHRQEVAASATSPPFM